jgi:hypothetical protein
MKIVKFPHSDIYHLKDYESKLEVLLSTLIVKQFCGFTQEITHKHDLILMHPS